VPIGSGATKIGDAAGGSYKQGKWRPGANQIASVWKKSLQLDQIHLLPSTGGSASVLYTAISDDWVIEDDIAFKSDGSNLVFSERQISTGNVFLKVLDVNTSSIIKSIALSQYRSIKEVDWAKSPGSNIVALTTIPRCDETTVGRSGMHQLQTIDVGAASPTLTWLRNDIGNISWKGDDTQISVNAGLWRVSAIGGLCSASGYFGLGIYTIATNSYTLPSYSQGDHADWKR